MEASKPPALCKLLFPEWSVENVHPVNCKTSLVAAINWMSQSSQELRSNTPLCLSGCSCSPIGKEIERGGWWSMRSMDRSFISFWKTRNLIPERSMGCPGMGLTKIQMFCLKLSYLVTLVRKGVARKESCTKQLVTWGLLMWRGLSHLSDSLSILQATKQTTPQSKGV